jgi:opacity protein-like surface antigen
MRKLLILTLLCTGQVLAETPARDLTGNFELAISAGKTLAPTIKNTSFAVGQPIGIESIDPRTRSILSDFAVKYKSGLNFAFEANYYFPEIRLGVELSRIKNKINELQIAGNAVFPLRLNGYTQATALMLNNYLDFFLQEQANLFVGLGVGGAKVTTKVNLDNTSNSTGKIQPAGQLILGAKYWLQDNYSVFTYYKYFRTLGKVSGLGKNMKSNSFNLGLSVVM